MRSRRATYGRDHPRMCGEHSNILDMSKLTAGSSPHVRGALAHYDDPFHMGGIIPACAGSTCVISHVVEKAWDHPRMCGEHRGIRGRVVVRLGSSPHVRGAPGHVPTHRTTMGIIPACAGSTDKLPEYIAAIRDHPRMCGEHPISDHWPTRVTGSSPHVRGALPSSVNNVAPSGIIPACAGSTPPYPRA